jgi:hypothetical protein
VVCQEQQLSKNDYYNLVGEAKLIFSANLQETLGISMYEGCLLNAIPMVPNRLSYQEMFYDTFKYPSIWTEDFDHYTANRQEICWEIIQHMDNYATRLNMLAKQTAWLRDRFFNADNLWENIK